jgi:hypothetical protein
VKLKDFDTITGTVSHLNYIGSVILTSGENVNADDLELWVGSDEDFARFSR